MRKFVITHASFAGPAELVYKDDGLLACIDISNAVMNQAFICSLKEKVPAHVNDIETAFKNSKVTVVETDFEVTFEMFWEKYNVKRNKQNALELWDKMKANKAEQVKAYYSLYAYERYCQRNPWYTKMYPDTYLRKKHYNDEWDKI